MNLFRPRGLGRPTVDVDSTAPFNNDAYVLQPRINLRRDAIVEEPTNLWTKLIKRSSECHATDEGNPCEKPSSGSTPTIPIVLATAIPAVVAVFVLIYLHRRNVKRIKAEDDKNNHSGLDFGLGPTPVGKKGARKSMFGGEKQIHKSGQLSMDMNLSSPYLLPPGVHQSQDSLHSVTRGIHNEHDPYRTVYQYSNSDVGSMRSFNPNKDQSSSNTRRGSAVTGRSMGVPMVPPPRTNSMPKPPATPTSPTSPFMDEKSDPFATPTIPQPAYQLPEHGEVHELNLPVQPIVPEIGHAAYPDELDGGIDMPDMPPAAMSRDHENGLPSPPAGHDRFELPAVPFDDTIGAANVEGTFELPDEHHNPAGLGLDVQIPQILSPDSEHFDNQGYHGQQPEIHTSQYYEDYEYEDAPVAEPVDQQQGLGVPIQASKRLSVGFRPLPPDEALESEDPEYRANRIRSFYKEYFDDSQNAPPMPGQEYQEDYDANYLGDAAYYDADTNAFVMPYAQPVTRRAMTPPPSGRNRGPPGRGPRLPHGPHGSLGGMSLPGGPRGRPRAGSAFSASGGFRGAPKKKLPPPAALSTLPAPSKLKDDSFALLGAMDFAPPETFKDHVAGRSQSPFGERRPYEKPRNAAASPLVTAFEELAALPSPHLLRKSSTFTGLDFAPPKKFKDAETLSDSGSIKSSRSGISALQLGALRSGAGRVSRLPGDTVFTQAALTDQLKPQWGLRS